MMMSAMRRSASYSGRSRKNSSKSKRRSRKASHDEESEKDRVSSQRSASEGRPQTRAELDNARPSPKRQIVIANHGDVADSGIDSGNGVTEPDALVTNPFRSSSSEPIETEPRLRSSLDEEHKDEQSSLLGDHAGRSATSLGHNASQPTVCDSTEHSSGSSSSRKRSSKSKRSKDRHSASADEADQILVSVNKSKEFPISDKTSTSDDPNLTAEPSASGAPDKSDKPSESHTKENLPSASEEKQHESSVKASGDESSADRKETAASSQARERRRKLEARLEQAKQSLTSPHISAAVDAYELSEGPLVGPPNTSLLHEFRRLFQQELTRLRMELDNFRLFCSKQMEQEAAMLYGRRPEDPDKNESSTQAKQAQDQKQKRDVLIDEEELYKREDDLAARVKDLHDYEKEILEVESMLNQRQAICERRQAALLALDEELHSLREDIFEKKESLRNDTDTSSERARKNWDFVRRHLTDKQAMLEATIQRHRTTIASANASLAAKDSLIAHLQKQLKEAQEQSKSLGTKVERLENKLVFASEEMHMMQQTKQDNTTPAISPASVPLRRLSRSARGNSLSSASSSLQPPSRESPTFNTLPRQKSATAFNSLQRQRSEIPELVLNGHRPLSAPGGGRRMSTHHPDVPSGGKDLENVAREQSLRRKSYRRSRSVSHSTVNSATNASAACTIV